MSSEIVTATELRERLVRKAAADEEFRARLLADPTRVVEKELGLTIPDGFSIQVHEERAGTSHLVLPPPAWLAEEDLEEAAGGLTCRRNIWTGAETCTRDRADYNYPPEWNPPVGTIGAASDNIT